MTEVTLRSVLDANMDSDAALRLGQLLEFDGPPTNCVGETPYQTLTQYGVKEEGESIYPDSETRCWTEAEAIWRFKRTFFAYLLERPAGQLAWRARPRVEQGPDGDYVVRCRFALLKKAPAQSATLYPVATAAG